MKKPIFTLLPVLLLVMSFAGCTPKARYERKLKHELSSGVRHDSLILGLYFGMEEKQFYTHCWELNKQGVIRQGESNTTVLYELKNQLKHPAVMDFYPKFRNGKIYELPIRIKYTGWAPWNKELSSDNLQLDVLRWFKIKYGKDFIKVKHRKFGAAYVNISGNRRITIFRENNLYIWAYITDLTVKNENFNPALNP